MQLRWIRALTLVALAACAKPRFVPPQPTAARSAMAVAASSAVTWRASIYELSLRALPIVSMDSSTGFISASRTVLPDNTDEEKAAGRLYADCGKTLLPSNRDSMTGAGDRAPPARPLRRDRRA